MTTGLDADLLAPLAAALAVDASPSEQELDDLNALLVGTHTAVFVPRMSTRARRLRTGPSVAAAAAIAVAAVALVGVLARVVSTPDGSAPRTVAPAQQPGDVAPPSVAVELAALRIALVRADPVAVESARNQLARAFDALAPSERERFRPEADALLAEADRFLAGTVDTGADEPAAPAPSAPEAADDPVAPMGAETAPPVAPAQKPTTPVESEPEDD